MNIDRIPRRSVKSLNDELRWLYNRIMEQKEPGFKWDYAVSCKKDRIFPSDNLISYWNNTVSTKHIILNRSHYLFHEWPTFPAFIRFVTTFEIKKTKARRFGKS